MKTFKTILIIVLFITSSCNFSKNKIIYDNQTPCSFSPSQEILGKSINVAKSILKQRYYVEQTIIFDEGESWPALVGYANDNKKFPLLLAQTSWEDNSIIQQVNILNGTISIREDSISIGMKFIDLLENVSREIPSAPDGYFYVSDKYCPNILYELESMEKDSILYYGKASDLEQIPKNTTVKNIIIKKNK